MKKQLKEKQRIRIYPYKMESKAAIAVAKALEALRIREKGNYAPKPYDVVVNWGNCNVPPWGVEKVKRIINHPAHVAIAGHKVDSYRMFDHHEVPTMEWTTDRAIARLWLEQGFSVVARKLARAYGGKGIIFINPKDYENLKQAQNAVPTAVCYTKYTPHSGEYRVHVVNGKVVDYVKKKKMSPEKLEEGGYKFNKFIRNHDNGWVFAREDVELPDGVAQAALDAVKALNLDFGAVDVIHSKRRGIFVLEVNTAPGLEGQTKDNYIEALKEVIANG